MQETRERFKRYIDAGFPIIYLNSAETDKCDALIAETAGDTWGVIEWNAATGFWDKKAKTPEADWTILDTLNLVNIDKESLADKIVVLKDIHPYLDDPKVVALLKKIAEESLAGLACIVVIVSPVCVIPKEIESQVTLMELDPVSSEEIRQIILDFIDEYELTRPTDKLIDGLVNSFKGLSDSEIKNILALAVADGGELYSGDLELVFEQKQQVIKKSGILEMVQVNETIDQIGGLDNLKDWLTRKAKVFKDIDKARAFGVDAPKGVLIAGMPGCGKSLNAKAAANLFEVPLLRMDMGRLLGKYVGESEANMRKALALADSIAPCVLWIDEMEKAFAGIGGSNGGAEVTTRLFGTFLTWLQEKKSLAFVVATANDISKMPPELLRKGRFDEIFYVDLPNEEERKKIFEIHIARRREADLPGIDLNTLAKETNGYSGADIEGVVKDAVEDAFANGKDKVELVDIKKAIKNTHSLTEIMKKSIEDMKKKYDECKFKNASY